MLILNLETAKHSQYIPVSAYYLNSDAIYSQWFGLSSENNNYQQTFYVIT